MTTSNWKDTLRAIKVPDQRATTGQADEFLTLDDIVTVKKDSLRRHLHRVLSEIEELAREDRWDDILALACPVEQKFPELCDKGLDLELRAKVSFALGQKSRFDDAIAQLKICVERDPSNFHYHSALAYNAYNSLYAAMNKEIFLRGKLKAERIELAHRHLRMAQELRPQGITNFYREGMLYKKIEGKSDRSIPLFQKAVDNWEGLGPEEKKARHQECKNYVKALYQLASALLDNGLARKALAYIEKCIEADRESNHLSMVYKYFALGKVHFELNEFREAKDALVFALEVNDNKPVDFVYELLARVWLALNNPQKALETILTVPEKKRRPYYRWTEADVYCAMGDFNRARVVLSSTLDRDRRSKHRALIKLAKIEYLLSNFKKAEEYAKQASEFFHERWGGILNDALFWQALCAYRTGDCNRSKKLALELKAHNPRYPKLQTLLTKLRQSESS